MFFQIYGLSVNQDLSCRQIIQLGQAVEKGGLSTAGRTDNAEKFPLFYVKRYIIKDKKVSELLCHILYAYFYIIHGITSHQRVLSTTLWISLRRLRNLSSV